MRLPHPVDPKTQKLKVEINDREYYVEVDLADEQPILFHGNEGVTCAPKVRDDTENGLFRRLRVSSGDHAFMSLILRSLLLALLVVFGTQLAQAETASPLRHRRAQHRHRRNG